MLQLLHLAWAWIILGSIFILLGVRGIGLSRKEWLSFLFTLPFIYFTDDTEEEKQTQTQSVEEAVSATPGCLLLVIGAICLVFGLVRIISS